MNRRGFLKSLKGAVGWVATAAAAESAAGLVPAYRDQILFIGHADAGGLGASFRFDVTATAQHQAGLFPQSVAAGDPNPFGAVLWTRIDPQVAGRGRLIVEWQIATDPDFTDGSVVLQGLAALASGDHTVKLPIQHPALRPFSTYYYRFIHQAVASRTGRFETMPRPGDTLAQLRVGYAVCQDFSNGYYTAYRYLAQEDVDVVVFLGDYIYEYRSDGPGGPDNGPVRVVPPYPSGADYPAGLADYRHLYQVYRSKPDIQATHERFAFIQLWDDHEFFNDCHQDFHEDTNPPGLSATSSQFDNPAEPPMGVELMVGAVSSGNYLDAAVDTPTAKPLPNLPAGAMRAAQLGLPLDGLAPAILAYNPHMAFWNGSTWGYAVLTITPQSLVCDYRVVSTVKTPDGVLQQLASFTVPAYEVAISQTV